MVGCGSPPFPCYATHVGGEQRTTDPDETTERPYSLVEGRTMRACAECGTELAEDAVCPQGHTQNTAEQATPETITATDDGPGIQASQATADADDDQDDDDTESDESEDEESTDDDTEASAEPELALA